MSVLQKVTKVTENRWFWAVVGALGVGAAWYYKSRGNGQVGAPALRSTGTRG